MSCPERAKVDLHFERRISVDDERAMREHLPSCAECKKRYERQLLLEKLDPAAAGPGARLARGLGLEDAVPAPSLEQEGGRVLSFPGRAMGLVGALAVAACLALLLYKLPKNPEADTSGFSSRGGGERGDGTDVVVYRSSRSELSLLTGASGGGAPRPQGARTTDSAAVRAGASIHKQDELAFGYVNPGGKQYLMIYGVDEHRHVYWYYPAWNDPAETPSSVKIELGATRRDLPDAVRHGLDGTTLEIHAVFTDKPLDVRTVERVVASATSVDRAPEGREAGAVDRAVRFQVEP